MRNPVIPINPKPAVSGAGVGAAPAPPAPARRARVQAAETGVAVLKGLAALEGRAALSALAAQVGEPAAKVHRYLSSLIEAGLVVQDSSTQHYQLGPEAIRIGVAALRVADPLRAAEPALARLRSRLQATAFLAVMGNLGPTIVRIDEPALPVRVNVRVGSVLSLLWSATGRAFIGALPADELLPLARAEWAGAEAARRAELPGLPAQPGRSEGPPESPPEGPSEDPPQARPDVAAALAVLRAQVQAAAGLATVRDSYLRGISAVAAGVRDHQGRVCAVLTVLGATGGFDADPQGPAACALRAEAEAASHALGWPVAPP